MTLSGMLSRCMVPFEGWNARGQGFEHPLCVERFVSPFEPFIRMTAVCAGAPCTTRRLSTAATKKTNLSKIRCVTKPVADAKRTLSAVQSCLPDDVVHAVHQRPARANIVKRTTSLTPKHAAEMDVQMNQNLARLKSFSSGHCLVTRPPSVVLNATSSCRTWPRRNRCSLQRELHPNNVVVAQQRHGSRFCLHVELRSNHSFSMSSPSPRGCHGCCNSASP